MTDVMVVEGTPDNSRRIQEWADGRVTIWTDQPLTPFGTETADMLEVLDWSGGKGGRTAMPGDLIVRDPRGGYRVAR